MGWKFQWKIVISYLIVFKKDDKYFQNNITVALNHKETGTHPVRIIRIKPVINKDNWKRINEPSEKDDWKKFEKNSLTITNNVPRAKKENMYPVYVSKHNWNRKKQVTLLTTGKLRRTALSCNRKAISIIKINDTKAMVTFIVWIVFTTLQEKNLNPIKKYLKIMI